MVLYYTEVTLLYSQPNNIIVLRTIHNIFQGIDYLIFPEFHSV